ncbi:YceI family protein [Phenylobacterium soli]|uniref:Cytochrome B n=1 Tax=Phenylobacterium soli TaxID=2170551 RepID=A0A328AHH3_9CAUL|nr:YceI family protein [Phenylobacterium soli]RAK54200.1 cytochrome B [Phenylobacterium soli]
MTDVAKDPKAAGSARYSLVAILLHWVIAAGIVLQVVLAGRMEGPRTPTSFAVTQLHKSIGITILLLSLVRLAWRLMNPPAPLPATMPRWERELARWTHVGFYVVMIAMPLTGWLMVSASRIPIPTLLYGVVPWPNLPLVGDLAPAAKKLWHDIGEGGHGVIAKVIYVLLALHVAGALKHQLFSKDEPVLARMAPGAVAGRWAEPRILIILLAFVGVIVFGRLVTPPPPGMAAPAPAVTPQGPAQEPAEAQAPGEPADADASPQTSPTGPAPSAAAPTAIAGPVNWAVQPGSTLAFTATWSGQPVKGRFDRWLADVQFSPEALDRSRVKVTIDVGSINTGDQQRDAVLPSGDWFDAAAHPKAMFSATRFEKTGPDRYVAHGTLQLRGVTKPQDLPFRLKIAGDKAEVSGVTTLDRTSFGIGQGEWSSTDQIPAKVSVNVSLTAKRE